MPNDTAAPTLTLALVDDDAHPATAPAPASPQAPQRPRIDLRITNADEFLAAAIAEYEAGRVDAALWARSESTTGGEEALAVAAYLRARATALRLEKRDARKQSAATAGDGPPTRAPTSAPTSAPTAAPGGVRATHRGDEGKARPHASARHAMRWKMAALAGGGFVLAVVIGVVVLSRSSTSAGVAPSTVNAARASTVRAQATRPGNPAPQNVQPAVQAAADPSLADRIAQLRQANNWNVLVLYATEWTRKEPRNGDAWRELAHGYAKLGQMPEALEAASQRAALADDAGAWGDVAHYAAALERWPEAGAAYDKVLAQRPDDVEALCGTALVARRTGHPADAETTTKRVAAAGNRCEDIAASTSAATSLPVPASGNARTAPRR